MTVQVFSTAEARAPHTRLLPIPIGPTTSTMAGAPASMCEPRHLQVHPEQPRGRAGEPYPRPPRLTSSARRRCRDPLAPRRTDRVRRRCGPGVRAAPARRAGRGPGPRAARSAPRHPCGRRSRGWHRPRPAPPRPPAPRAGPATRRPREERPRRRCDRPGRRALLGARRGYDRAPRHRCLRPRTGRRTGPRGEDSSVRNGRWVTAGWRPRLRRPGHPPSDDWLATWPDTGRGDRRAEPPPVRFPTRTAADGAGARPGCPPRLRGRVAAR